MTAAHETAKEDEHAVQDCPSDDVQHRRSVMVLVWIVSFVELVQFLCLSLPHQL